MRVLLGLSWLASAVLAIQVVDARNASAPLPTSAVLTVTTWDGGESAAGLRASLAEFARTRQVTLAQETPDLEQGRTMRHLYLADGDPQVAGSEWVSDGIGDFGESMNTQVHPLSEAGSRSPVGNWIVFGDSSKVTAVQQFLASHGALTEVAYVPASAPYLRHASVSVQVAIGVIALLLVGTTGAFAVSRTRRYAIERLHGARRVQLFAQELAPLALIWTGSGLVLLVCAAAFVLARYEGVGLTPFLTVMATLATLLFLAMALALALVMAMVNAVDVLGALKGRMASTALTVSAYAMRASAVLVALTLGAGTASLLADQSERARVEQPLQALGDASILSLGNAYTEREQDELGRTVGGWLRELDNNGELIVALQQDTSGLPSVFARRELLVVNGAFLATQPVRLADGRLMDRARGSQAAVIVPGDGWSQRQALDEVLGVQLEPVLGGRPGAGRDMVRAAPDQTFSTLTVPSQLLDSPMSDQASLVTDPVIVVVPSALSQGYVEGVTSGQVLLTNPQAAIADVAEDENLARFVRSVTPVRERAQEAAAEQNSALRSALFSTTVAYLVVVMAGVAAVIIYTRRHAQRSFARHLHGWRIAASYRSLIVLEGCLLLLLLGWIPRQIYQERQEFAAMAAVAPLPGGLPTLGLADGTAMGVLALITTGGFTATLLFVHRRLVQHGVSEA